MNPQVYVINFDMHQFAKWRFIERPSDKTLDLVAIVVLFNFVIML